MCSWPHVSCGIDVCGACELQRGVVLPRERDISVSCGQCVPNRHIQSAVVLSWEVERQLGIVVFFVSCGSIWSNGGDSQCKLLQRLCRWLLLHRWLYGVDKRTVSTRFVPAVLITAVPLADFRGGYSSVMVALCIFCAGYFCPVGSTNGTVGICPAGYQCPGASGGNGTGLPCPTGQFSTSGAVSCTQCPATTFNNMTGQTSCPFTCPPGYYCPGKVVSVHH